MQFLFEIIILLVLFSIFRLAVLKAFPVDKLGMPMSAESERALKKFRNRYRFLFFLFVILFSLGFWFGLNAIIKYVHAQKDVLVYTVELIALLLPSALLGLLTATYVARWVNHKLQPDGLSFFFEGYTDELEGFDRNQLKIWQVAIGVIIAVALIVTQGSIYIKVDSSKVVAKNNLFESPQSAPLSMTQVLNAGDQKLLILNQSDTVNLKKYAGDKGELLTTLQE